MRYSLDAGGKRLRPILTLAAAEAVAGRSANAEQAIAAALPAACAVELIHTYSLIHDDLPAMDDDSLRRGRPTNHIVHGEGMAILAGDGLLTEAFALLATEPRDPTWPRGRSAPFRVVAVAAGARGMVGGQAIDLHAVGSTSFDEQSLQDMHARKTGALIRAAAVAGAIMGGGTDEAIRAVEEYGRQLGLAFQIVDDILDVEGERSSARQDRGQGRPSGQADISIGLSGSTRRAVSLPSATTVPLPHCVRQVSTRAAWPTSPPGSSSGTIEPRAARLRMLRGSLARVRPNSANDGGRGAGRGP